MYIRMLPGIPSGGVVRFEELRVEGRKTYVVVEDSWETALGPEFGAHFDFRGRDGRIKRYSDAPARIQRCFGPLN